MQPPGPIKHFSENQENLFDRQDRRRGPKGRVEDQEPATLKGWPSRLRVVSQVPSTKVLRVQR